MPQVCLLLLARQPNRKVGLFLNLLYMKIARSKRSDYFFMAGNEGLEPPMTGPEPVALPLGEFPIHRTLYLKKLTISIIFICYSNYMTMKLNIDNKEANQKCLNEIIGRIQDIEDPSRVGVIAAQDIIDIVIENLGPEIYNQAVKDADKLIQVKLDDLKYEIEELKR